MHATVNSNTISFHKQSDIRHQAPVRELTQMCVMNGTSHNIKTYHMVMHLTFVLIHGCHTGERADRSEGRECDISRVNAIILG